MAFTITLLCIVLQRFMHVTHGKVMGRRWHEVGFNYYYAWIKRSMGEASWANGAMLDMAIVLPVFIALIVLIAILYHLFGPVFYYVLSVAVLWYAMDATRFDVDCVAKQAGASLIVEAYQRIFSLIFWFALFGLYGLVLYIIVERLSVARKDEASINWLGILDWLPIRLLTLTYALVGHFSALSGVVIDQWKQSYANQRDVLVESAMVAVDLTPSEAKQAVTADQLSILERLVERALWVWLVVMALFVLGQWLA